MTSVVKKALKILVFVLLGFRLFSLQRSVCVISVVKKL
ncbi:MAG: hypothetical protein OFPII_11340 [Osedax symbiont Rs1]|nr:MAG: hypothetical protein OFPII_11340 [Osedax symbiont Rs1]